MSTRLLLQHSHYTGNHTITPGMHLFSQCADGWLKHASKEMSYGGMIWCCPAVCGQAVSCNISSTAVGTTQSDHVHCIKLGLLCKAIDVNICVWGSVMTSVADDFEQLTRS